MLASDVVSLGARGGGGGGGVYKKSWKDGKIIQVGKKNDLLFRLVSIGQEKA